MGAFDERRKGLEEEYFNRQNKEAIEKLRQKMAYARQAKAEGLSSMNCPRCDGTLKESTIDDVTIDTCEKCSGVWLDSSELAQLMKREDPGWLSALWNSWNDQ